MADDGLPEDGKNPEETNEDLAQFKDPQALLQSYKELQGTFTKTSQQNKDLQKKIEELEETIALSKSAPPTNQNPNFDDQYIENPQAAMHQTVLTMRIAEVLEDEQDADPDAYPERYNAAKQVIGQYPNLGRTPGGIKKAFKQGDKLRQMRLKDTTDKMMKAVFGDDITPEQIANFKETLKGGKPKTTNSDAYMPETDTSTVDTKNQNQRPDVEAEITEYAEKGDLDGVLNAQFKAIMAE